MNTFLIREEHSADRQQVWKVNEAAFGRPDEADLVDNLRAEGAVLLSLVAEAEGAIVGHILFSRMWVETAQESVPVVALAPIAVLPDHQGRQVGRGLIRRGLTELGDRGEPMVIVLGHKGYYPRFGFSTETARSLASPFPPDAFMALELSQGASAGLKGTVRYAAAFGL